MYLSTKLHLWLFCIVYFTFLLFHICTFFVFCICTFLYFLTPECDLLQPWHQDTRQGGKWLFFFSLPKTRIVGKYIYVHFIRERCILFWPCYIQELRIPNHLADSLGDLIDHIGYLPTSLLLQIALLASSIVLS